MNVLLWILQVFLALAFFAHGWLFLFPPASMLEPMKPIPVAFRLFLGIAEVAAAIGLTLPGITRIQPRLVPAASAGIMIVMISATIFHTVRGELSSAFVTLILLGMATFVTYMRWKVHPIQPRAVA